jgi:phosphatidylglycerophosphate synthase
MTTEPIPNSDLIKDTDGFIARFDRHFSIALSRLLVPTPITPNHITTFSLFLAIAGCWGVASGIYRQQVLGALALWFCCILDGCDGELARLKNLCSPWGAAYDLTVDHITHFITFVAIAVGLHRGRPDLFIWPAAILLLTGFLASAFSVWYLVLRVPQAQRGRMAILIERLASRDYVYLILACIVLDRLYWFVWAAGIGSHFFYLALWWLSLKRPSTA